MTTPTPDLLPGVPNVRTCRQCKETKPLSEYYTKSVTKICKVCARQNCKDRYRKNSGIDKVRRANWARYGITADNYERMLAEQRGVCAICGNPQQNDRALAVDHCHATGKVRGLLCAGCNTALAGSKDRPDVLRKCAEYLEAHADEPAEDVA